MNWVHLRLQLVKVVAIVVWSVVIPAPTWAQVDDGWSFILTPQVWISHIAKNGFASPPNSNLVGGAFVSQPTTNPNVFTVLQNPFPTTESSPSELLNPQWGLQLAAQKGRLTLAAAFQYVTFETRNTLTYVSPNNAGEIAVSSLGASIQGPFCFIVCINPGERWAQELLSTTRMDVDLSIRYFFPDVVTNRVDVYIGAGFKFIYASASREFIDLSPTAHAIRGRLTSGLYTVCSRDNLDLAFFPPPGCVGRDRVKQKSYLYAATIPLSTTLHLTNDATWLLPFSVTPLIGVETRNDSNVVYSFTPPATFILGQLPLSGRVNRARTTLAYGVTADATVRWIVNDTLSAYAGMRVQYINGQDTYLAYGPLVGMSVRFGGK